MARRSLDKNPVLALALEIDRSACSNDPDCFSLMPWVSMLSETSMIELVAVFMSSTSTSPSAGRPSGGASSPRRSAKVTTEGPGAVRVVVHTAPASATPPAMCRLRSKTSSRLVAPRPCSCSSFLMLPCILCQAAPESEATDEGSPSVSFVTTPQVPAAAVCLITSSCLNCFSSGKRYCHTPPPRGDEEAWGPRGKRFECLV